MIALHKLIKKIVFKLPTCKTYYKIPTNIDKICKKNMYIKRFI